MRLFGGHLGEGAQARFHTSQAHLSNHTVKNVPASPKVLKCSEKGWCKWNDNISIIYIYNYIYILYIIIYIYCIISWYSDIHGRGAGDEAGICETWSYHSLEGKQVVTQNCRQIQVWGSYPIGRLRPYSIIPYCSSFINQNRRAWIHNAMNNISTCQNKCGFKWAAQITNSTVCIFSSWTTWLMRFNTISSRISPKICADLNQTASRFKKIHLTFALY